MKVFILSMYSWCYQFVDTHAPCGILLASMNVTFRAVFLYSQPTKNKFFFRFVDSKTVKVLLWVCARFKEDHNRLLGHHDFARFDYSFLLCHPNRIFPTCYWSRLVRWPLGGSGRSIVVTTDTCAVSHAGTVFLFGKDRESAESWLTLRPRIRNGIFTRTQHLPIHFRFPFQHVECKGPQRDIFKAEKEVENCHRSCCCRDGISTFRLQAYIVLWGILPHAAFDVTIHLKKIKRQRTSKISSMNTKWNVYCCWSVYK